MKSSWILKLPNDRRSEAHLSKMFSVATLYFVLLIQFSGYVRQCWIITGVFYIRLMPMYSILENFPNVSHLVDGSIAEVFSDYAESASHGDSSF